MRYDEVSIYGVDVSGNKKIIKVDTDGTTIVKPVGGGDASATKQDQQTAILQTLLTEGTAADGIAGPAGGSGAFKWFSGIWNLVNSIKGVLPSTLVGDRFKVDLPATAAQDHITANSPASVRLTDGTNFYQGSTEATLGKLIWTSTAITSTSTSYSSQNGSEKTWTVPTGVEWQVTDFYADFVTSSTVGNRQLTVRITDASDNVYCRLPVGITQSASLTRRYSWGVGLPDMTSFRDTDKLETPLVPLILPAGFKIKIVDTTAVDTVGDALTVRGLVLQRST